MAKGRKLNHSADLFTLDTPTVETGYGRVDLVTRRPRPCANHPRCTRNASKQVWCAPCWSIIPPELQAKLEATYNDQQAFTGECRAWLEVAFQTPKDPPP